MDAQNQQLITAAVMTGIIIGGIAGSIMTLVFQYVIRLWANVFNARKGGDPTPES